MARRESERVENNKQTDTHTHMHSGHTLTLTRALSHTHMHISDTLDMHVWERMGRVSLLSCICSCGSQVRPNFSACFYFIFFGQSLPINVTPPPSLLSSVFPPSHLQCQRPTWERFASFKLRGDAMSARSGQYWEEGREGIAGRHKESIVPWDGTNRENTIQSKHGKETLGRWAKMRERNSARDKKGRRPLWGGG